MIVVKEQKTYRCADITLKNGQLVIDTLYASNGSKYYDVEITLYSDNTIKVKGDRPQIGHQLLGYTAINPDLVKDDHCEYVKPWPWSKEKVRRVKRDIIYELKDRETRTYTSNN